MAPKAPERSNPQSPLTGKEFLAEELAKIKAAKKYSDEYVTALEEAIGFFEASKVNLTRDGARKMLHVFRETTGHFLEKKRNAGRWKGTLKRFVNCCTEMIACELAKNATTRFATPKDVDAKAVQKVAVRWMKRFKDVSTECGPAIQERIIEESKTGTHGEVCTTYLDSI